MVGCGGWSDETEEIFVTEGGARDLDGERISVQYFAESGSVDDYVQAGAPFGGLYLVGPNWVVEAKRATLDELRSELGGDISDAS